MGGGRTNVWQADNSTLCSLEKPILPFSHSLRNSSSKWGCNGSDTCLFTTETLSVAAHWISSSASHCVPFFHPPIKQSAYYHFPLLSFYNKTWRFFFCLIWISLVGRLTPAWDPDTYLLYLDRAKEMDPSETYFTVKPGRIGSGFSWIRCSDREGNFSSWTAGVNAEVVGSQFFWYNFLWYLITI